MKLIITLIAILFGVQSLYSQCACCAGASIASSSGDNSNAAVTLDKGKWMLEAYGDYRIFEEGVHHGSEAEEEEGGVEETHLENLTIGVFGLRYGLTKRITLSVAVPYVFVGTDVGSANGLGDLVVLSTFKLYSKNNFNIGLTAGVELPVGERKNSTFDETTVVVGSGSYDPMAGLTIAKGWNKLSLKGNLLGKHTTNGFEDANYGSLIVQQINAGYQLRGINSLCTSDSLKTNRGFSWNVFGGYYGEWLGKIEEDGEKDPNTGYYLGFASLGTSIGYAGWNIPITFLLPAIQELNGEQNKTRYRVRVGLTKVF
jgi:hypothetical protein